MPSARFRVRQYVADLAQHGVQIDEVMTRIGTYPPSRRWLRPAWGVAAIAGGVARIAHSWSHDVSLFQRELVSTLVTAEPLARRPRILDVDDAIFLYRGGRSARRLAQLCDAVVCGNPYLAEWFGRWNRRVHVVPTAVDTRSHVPRPAEPNSHGVVAGWIGTSSNLEYLQAIEPALQRFMAAEPSTRLRVISDRPPRFATLPPERTEFVRWSADAEVRAIQGIDIGLMPLADTPWTRGKCSFKMLQYMACGLPVVVSPVGMNAEVLRLGTLGLAASRDEEWSEAMLALARDSSLRGRLGAEGRRVAEAVFSVPVVARQLAQCLHG